jgi:hypothetical protein
MVVVIVTLERYGTIVYVNASKRPLIKSLLIRRNLFHPKKIFDVNRIFLVLDDAC